MYHDKHSQVAHEIRAVRARIMALSEEERPRVLVVTSSDRAEGKTTLAVNLAAAFCETGEGRVVVVDGDIPAPSLLDVAANATPSAGVIEALRGDLDLERTIYRTRIPGLDVIPCVSTENLDGVDQLFNEKLPAFIERLRGLYAYVIVDAPPVHVGQACTLAAQSDGVLLVAQLERVKRHVAKHAVDQLVQSGAKVLGCVLTKRRHHVPDFLYRFFGTRSGYYYYGYGYSRRKKLASRTGTSAPKANAEGTAPAAGDREEEG
jgi:capsular exopolysaccharide synthesis family protein